MTAEFDDVLHVLADYYEHPERFRTSDFTFPSREWDDETKVTFTIPAIGDLLRQCGLEFCGSGHFSNVYDGGGDRVLKIINRNPDPGYPKFVELAREMRHNPYFPRIYESGTVGSFPYYILERLYGDCFHERDELCSAIRARSRFVQITCPILREAVDALYDRDLIYDIRVDNLLCRANGEIVITDPMHV